MRRWWSGLFFVWLVSLVGAEAEHQRLASQPVTTLGSIGSQWLYAGGLDRPILQGELSGRLEWANRWSISASWNLLSPIEALGIDRWSWQVSAASAAASPRWRWSGSFTAHSVQTGLAWSLIDDPVVLSLELQTQFELFQAVGRVQLRGSVFELLNEASGFSLALIPSLKLFPTEADASSGWLWSLTVQLAWFWDTPSGGWQVLWDRTGGTADGLIVGGESRWRL